MTEDWSLAPEEKLVEALRESALRSKFPEDLIREIVARGDHMVEPLGILLTRDVHEGGNPDDAVASAALHLLGIIGSPSAAPWILDWLRMDPQGWHATETTGAVLGRLGPEAIHTIAAGITDEWIDTILRGCLVSGLVEIGLRNPSARPEVAGIIEKTVTKTAESCDETLLSWVVINSTTVHDRGVKSAILAAFERGDIDEMVLDRNDYLKDQSTQPPWSCHFCDRDLMDYFLNHGTFFAHRTSLVQEPYTGSLSAQGKKVKKKSKHRKKKKAGGRRKNKP